MENELMNDNYKSPIPGKYRWRNWAADPEGITGDELLEFVNNALFKTLKDLQIKLDADKRGLLVRSLFEDAHNYVKSRTMTRDEQIKQKVATVIDEAGGIALNPHFL